MGWDARLRPQAINMTDQCPRCDGTGWILAPKGGARRCVCIAQARQRSQVLSLPPKFRNVSFENYHPRNETQRVVRERMLKSPGGNYFISGDYGAGKTHVACAQYNSLVSEKKGSLQAHKPVANGASADGTGF